VRENAHQVSRPERDLWSERAMTRRRREESAAVLHEPDPPSSHPLAAVSASERTRLVRLCAAFTGDSDIAEGLAQEALAEVWSHRDRLTDPAGADRWPATIARNVCRRWLRHRGVEAAHVRRPARGTGAAGAESGCRPADPLDIELQLKREDLAALLDRALAVLPPTTRSILLQDYVDELPQTAIAERLGLSDGAVAVRVHRGKLTLRRLLASPEFRPLAVANGFAVPTTPAFRQMDRPTRTLGAHPRR
jgi:RNA polymerase sigma factor (sigma-70 family)